MSDEKDQHQKLREAAADAVQAVNDWRGAPPAVRLATERLGNTNKLRDAAEMTVDSLQSWSSAPPPVRDSISDLEKAVEQAEDPQN